MVMTESVDTNTNEKTSPNQIQEVNPFKPIPPNVDDILKLLSALGKRSNLEIMIV